jgi:pimeloyl-ACP methyl ester carboxylesterase/class 3 adenylate cyclase
MVHVTRYARSGAINIAYQIIGEGTLDLVLIPGWVSNIELAWDEPRFARFLGRFAAFSRLLLFDKRGTGLSDRVSELPTLEQRMDDVRAVMDAADSERAAIVGYSEGGTMSALFAASYPDRTSSLVMYGAYPKRVRSPDYPWAPTAEERERWLTQIVDDWGSPVRLEALAPSLASDARFRDWWATYLRQSASPGAAQALSRMNSAVDIRQILPSIRVPTLILHRSDDRICPPEGSRYMADRIPGATFVELPGPDHLPFAGDVEALVDVIEQFLTGAPPPVAVDRVLMTLLSVDIVESTRHASQLGDRRWRDLLAAYRAAVEAQIVRFRGIQRSVTGDGVLATFDGPARAIRCATAIVDASEALGLSIRAGVHTGECDLAGQDVAGIAVHIAARVGDLASPSEVVVTGTVKDLVAGSQLRFKDRGRRTLQGVPGFWHILAVQRDT